MAFWLNASVYRHKCPAAQTVDVETRIQGVFLMSPPTGWSEVQIAGKRTDLFVPRNPGENRPTPYVMLYLHGHGLISLRDNPVYTQLLEEHSLVCVCPIAGRAWWSENICSDFDETLTAASFLKQHVLPWITETFGTVSPGIALAGVSMGGQAALRFAYQKPQQFPVVAAISPAIDFHLWHGRGLPLDELYPTQEAARQDTAILYINPLNWPRHQFIACDPDDTEWFDGADRLAMKLSSTGIPFESDLTTRNGGHTWEYFNHLAARVVGFVANGLEKERNRLPTVPFGKPEPKAE